MRGSTNDSLPCLTHRAQPPRLLSLLPPQFGAGWWVLIDGFGMGVNVLQNDAAKAASGYAWLPLFAATIGYVM